MHDRRLVVVRMVYVFYDFSVVFGIRRPQVWVGHFPGVGFRSPPLPEGRPFSGGSLPGFGSFHYRGQVTGGSYKNTVFICGVS